MSAPSALKASALAGLIVLVLLAPATVAADDGDDPAISQLSAVVREGRLYVDLLATQVLDPNSLSRLESGLPINLEFEVEVRNERPGWFNKSLASAQVELQTVYDAVTREYTVTRRIDGELIDVSAARSVEELEPMVSQLAEFVVLQVADLSLGSSPIVRARLVTRRRTWLWVFPAVAASAWQTTPLTLDSVLERPALEQPEPES